MTGHDLAAAIADRLRTHQWYDNPRFPNLHAPSAHGTHEGYFTTDCRVCMKDVDRIAAVAAQVAAEHYAPVDSIERASRWIEASGIPVHPAEQVRAWLDGLGVPVPLGIQQLMTGIRVGVIRAGDAAYEAGRSADRAAAPAAVVTIERPDDEEIEVHVNGQVVASANHDEHGWSGMDAVERTALAVARALGAPHTEREG